MADQAGFDATERATVAEVTGRLLAAVRTATGCDRVYQWATMDAYPHFHLWLVPWSEDAALRGPRYLVDAIVDRTPDEAATLAAVERLQRALVRLRAPGRACPRSRVGCWMPPSISISLPVTYWPAFEAR